MVRPIRIEFPGALYHITSRGNERRNIYQDPQDRVLFLEILGSTAGRWGWLCHAYCLMGNHYHLLIETPEGILARGMRQLNGEYTQAYNRRHHRCGHLFQGRYHSVLVEKETHLLELCRYIVLNPVRVPKMRVHSAGDWPWSSYRATAGREPAPTFLHTNWVLGRFDKDLSRAREAYQVFIQEGLTYGPSPEVQDGLWMGGKELAALVRDKVSGLREIPDLARTQRLAARPCLGEFLPPDVVGSLSERNQAMARAYFEGRYTQREIADHLGLHFTTVSDIVRALERERLPLRPPPGG